MGWPPPTFDDEHKLIKYNLIYDKLGTEWLSFHQRHRQTDGQTDIMQSQYRALH